MRHLELVYENLHDIRYEGGALINSGFQIQLVNEKRNMIQAVKPLPVMRYALINKV